MTSTTPDRSSWVEGERVFGPPAGSYDADWVASAALAADPSLTPGEARQQAVRWWQARRAGEAPPDGVVARVAEEYCRLYGVAP